MTQLLEEAKALQRTEEIHFFCQSLYRQCVIKTLNIQKISKLFRRRKIANRSRTIWMIVIAAMLVLLGPLVGKQAHSECPQRPVLYGLW